MRGETPLGFIFPFSSGISIHSPHARGDRRARRRIKRRKISIHSPHARGDKSADASGMPSMHFNPLPSCEGRHDLEREIEEARAISIHSPHARGDTSWTAGIQQRIISIHSPHARGDGAEYTRSAPYEKFQSTPLMRGETRYPIFKDITISISIHSPHARGDPASIRYGYITLPISIHSPHARGDRCKIVPRPNWNVFQSTPLMRGETA
mgnify:CR=1 FL=1